MTRWVLVIVCLVALGLGRATAQEADQGGGAGAISLDDRLKHELASLPHLWGKRLVAGGFDDKVVVVTFFASWCPPCRAEFRNLKEVYAAYAASGVEIVAINRFEDFAGLSNAAKLDSFLDRFDPAFSVVAGNESISRRFGDITRIPTLFVFDRKGRTALAFLNERGATETNLSAGELRAVISPLL